MNAEQLFAEGLIAERTGRLREAIRLYENAFGLGHLTAGYRLGVSDSWGPMIMSRSDALFWTESAAQKGHALSAALFARAVFKGETTNARIKSLYFVWRSFVLMLEGVLSSPKEIPYDKIPAVRKF